jgi:hypothetical protein
MRPGNRVTNPACRTTTKALEAAFFDSPSLRLKTMSRRESLQNLHIALQCLQKELKGSDEERVEAAQEAYQELLDDFCEEYPDLLSPQQFEKAKDEPDYFLGLIQLVYHSHQDQEMADYEEEQLLPYMNWELLTRI